MKKTKLFKSLLVAAGLCVGASAWAEEWSIDFTAFYSANNYTEDQSVVISSKVATIGGTDMGTCTVGNQAFNSNFVLQTGTKWLLRTGGLYQFNSGGRALGMLNCTKGQIITIAATGDPNPSTNVTLKSSSNGTYVYTVNEDGNVKFTPARYLYFTSISVANPSATDVDYTVKYVDGNNNEIKTAATYSGNPGTSITLGDNDKAPIYKDNKKYIYSSDDSEGKTISSDGTTVVTVTFREAATYSWTAKSSVGDYTTSGEAFEGDKAKVKYPLYVLVDGKLWTKGATNQEFAQSFDVTENNQEFTLQYTETEIENVVFLTEMEDVEGIGIVNSGNAEARSSQRAAGYSASGNTKFATLPAGKYQMYARFYSPTSAGGNYKFYAGNREIWAQHTENGNATDANAEIMLAQESNDLFLGQTGATSAVDFVYIVKTADLTEEELAEVQAADVEANTTKYYIVGNMNNWAANEDYRMVLNEDAQVEEYSLTLNLESGNEFKVIGVLGTNTTWYPGEGDNYPVSNTSKYKVYFRPNYNGGNGWHYGCIYAASTPTYTVAGDEALFGSNWNLNDTNNELVENADGTYSITYTNVALTENVKYKVVKDHAYANGQWPLNDRVIGISMAGNYDVTIVFNPNEDNVYEVMAVYKSISDAGYATFCAPYDLNFAETGVKAYTATVNNGEVSFTEVTAAKANTGLLLKAEAGEYKFAMESCANETPSALVGVLVDTPVAAGIYVLMNPKDGPGVGFYQTTKEFTVGANTAYIPALEPDSEGGARTFIAIDGETTGIEGVAAEKNFNGEIYNLQGQRVMKAQKGLYIINGKKVLVK